MTSILDRFDRPSVGFEPKTTQDLFALRLAQKLGDAPAAGHYAALVAEHSQARLLTAYRRAVRNAPDGDLGGRFHAELERASDNRSDMRGANLLAVRVERRSIAAAVFHGEQLEYTQMRHLSSVKEKALSSAVGFVNWILESFPIESVALEALSNTEEIQRQILTDAITENLRERILPIWQIPKTQLFEACGHPALKSRKQVREVITAVWPVLAGANGKTFIQDAAALGLYVQTERLFIIN
jgi:hypothetical protein